MQPFLLQLKIKDGLSLDYCSSKARIWGTNRLYCALTKFQAVVPEPHQTYLHTNTEEKGEPTLDVDGASLYHGTFSNDSLLLLIPSAQGNRVITREIARHLAATHKFVSWHRRGFSKSCSKGL